MVKSLSEAMVKLKKQRVQDKKSPKPSPAGKTNPSTTNRRSGNAGVLKNKASSGNKNSPKKSAKEGAQKSSSEKKRVHDEENKGPEREAIQLKKQRQSVKPNYHLVGCHHSYLSQLHGHESSL